MAKQGLTGYLFPRSSRLKSKKTISRLFNKEGRRIYRFPISLVYLPVEDEVDSQCQLLLSVPKRRFSRAVDRNRIKRQLRESFRVLWPAVRSSIEGKGAFAVMIMYSHHQMLPYAEIEKAVKSSLDEFVKTIV